MDISEFQKVIFKTYIHHDKRRGVLNTMRWFMSEAEELEEAIIKGDPIEIEEELADTLAWLVSVANLIGVDLGEVAMKKYGDGCPKCNNIPCRCEYREKPD
jgi:NTP pyrophosphatase (non-canonical NTP hydrolase)